MRRLGWLLALILALIPPLLVGWLTVRFAPDVPILDEWSLVQDIDHYRDGSLTFTEVWRSHNGHRIPLPRMIQVLLAVASDWDVRWPMALSWLLMLGAAALVARRLAPAVADLPPRLRAGVIAVGSLAMFSTNQFENWLWGFMLSVFLAVAATVATLSLLSVDTIRWPRFLASLGCALAASASFGSALAVWPAGALILLLSPDRRRKKGLLIGWCLSALVVAGLYLRPSPGDANATTHSIAFAQPLSAIYFIVTFLGAPVVSFAGSAWPPRDSGVGFAAGSIALAILLGHVVAWWRAGRPALPSWARFAVGLTAMSMGAAILAALGRADSGGPGAFASRYGSWSTALWLVLLALAARCRPRRLALLACTILATAIGVSWLDAFPAFRARRDVLALADDALYYGGPESTLALLTPSVEQIHSGRPTLLRRHLSVFRQSRPPRAADAVALREHRQTIRVSTTSIPSETRMPTPLAVEVANPSQVVWPYLGRDAGQGAAVRLSSRWFRLDGGLAAEGARTDLPHDLGPGERLATSVCIAPPAPGTYVLEIGLVQEGVAWFDEPWRQQVVVRAGVARRLRRGIDLGWGLLGGAGCR